MSMTCSMGGSPGSGAVNVSGPSAPVEQLENTVCPDAVAAARPMPHSTIADRLARRRKDRECFIVHLLAARSQLCPRFMDFRN
jgi:hypothetical protein